MTQEIVQDTDFSAIEDAIELWAATGSLLGDLPPIEDKGGDQWSRVNWEGFDFKRARPQCVLSIVSDASPGKPCKEKGLVGGFYQTIKTYIFDWNVQIAFFQDAYDKDGIAIRTTARQYAKNLVDNYEMPPIAKILQDQGIAFQPLSRTIRPGGLPDSDSDKYIHQATIEFHFQGINQLTLKDSDYFTSIDNPVVTYSGE